jgi:hypothetical protein
MTRRRKRSRKRSAASSTAVKRLEQAVFYLDESIYSRLLCERLRASGAMVRHAGEAFPFGSPDAVWLAGCGKQGWVVLSRDQRIRRRPLELLALRDAGVAAFIFSSGAATAADTADVVERLLLKFAHMSVSEPKPFLYVFGLSRRLTRIRL